MIIVFGAAGFIGTYLVDQLVTDNFDVLASDISPLGQVYYKKQGIPFIRLDITGEKGFGKLPQKGVEAVVNLACLQPANVSEAAYSPIKYIETNTIGTLNVLEFCRKTKVNKVICFNSHRAAEGLWGTGKPIREEAKAIKYTGEYAMYVISESAAADCVEHYRQKHGMQAIIFRLPPVYGYGPHTEIFKNGKPIKTGFKIFIENATAGKPLEVWGDSKKGRDIIYVKDVVAAIIRALKSPKAAGTYNIASGRTLSLEEEAKGIIKVFSPKGHPSKITYRPEKPNSIESFLYDIGKAKKELGWSPKYSFEEMLADYKKEMASERFRFLLEKRILMLHQKPEDI